MTDVSVVIPTHHRPAMLRRSLGAVCADVAASEIIVVRDRADVGAENVIAAAAHAHPRVRAIEAPADVTGVERGQAARDAGVRAAHGEVVLAIDDDVIAHPGLVSGHARHHRADRDLVVVGYMPVVLPPRGVPGRAAAALYATHYERVVASYRECPEAILSSLWGGNVSVARAEWLTALERGAVDGAYHGDRAFGLQLREQGLKGRFDPRLRADHWYRRTLEQIALDARSAAIGRARIGAAYLGTYDVAANAARAAFRPGLSILNRLTPSDAAAQALLTKLSTIGRVAAGRRLHAVEYLLTRLVWRLAYDRARVDG